MLKRSHIRPTLQSILQPPPRGCVLKPFIVCFEWVTVDAAASARLCVETPKADMKLNKEVAAASARLCVETLLGSWSLIRILRSRLRVAVC